MDYSFQRVRFGGRNEVGTVNGDLWFTEWQPQKKMVWFSVTNMEIVVVGRTSTTMV